MVIVGIDGGNAWYDDVEGEDLEVSVAGAVPLLFDHLFCRQQTEAFTESADYEQMRSRSCKRLSTGDDAVSTARLEMGPEVRRAAMAWSVRH